MISSHGKSIIRYAKIDDLPRIVDIYNRAIPGRQAVADTEDIAYTSRLTWFHQHNPESRPLLVAEEDDQVVAWAGFQSYNPQPAFCRTVEVSVFVADEYQRKGIGTLLLSRLIRDCSKYGVAVVIGYMFSHNNAVIRLNKKLGFKVWGRLKNVGCLDDKSFNLLIMGLEVIE